MAPTRPIRPDAPGRARGFKKPSDPTSAAAARDIAVGLLARRDFASGELRTKLEQRGFDASAAAGAIQELLEERILDDVRYAGHYVSYHAARGQGPVRIADDLRSFGLHSDLVSVALAEGPDWLSLARDVRARKFGPEEPASWAEKTRQARFLQYRGFSSDHIRFALGPDFDPD
jgi:regulatory protein